MLTLHLLVKRRVLTSLSWEGNDASNDAFGGVGNDDVVGTINVPSGGEKICSGEGKKPTEMKKPSVIKKGGSEGSVPPGGEKVGSGEGKKPVEMKKPGAVKKGGGEVSVGGGGVGLPSGDNVPMSGTIRKKNPSFVAGGSGTGDIPSGIPNPNDPEWQQFFL